MRGRTCTHLPRFRCLSSCAYWDRAREACVRPAPGLMESLALPRPIPHGREFVPGLQDPDGRDGVWELSPRA